MSPELHCPKCGAQLGSVAGSIDSLPVYYWRCGSNDECGFVQSDQCRIAELERELAKRDAPGEPRIVIVNTKSRSMLHVPELRVAIRCEKLDPKANPKNRNRIRVILVPTDSTPVRKPKKRLDPPPAPGVK